jgi:hypothetical protein
MEAIITETATSSPSQNSTSRPGALIWFLRKSRDRWKQKHHALKASVKGYKNRIADLTKSRQQWELKAEDAAARLTALEGELAALRAENAVKKKSTAPSLR